MNRRSLRSRIPRTMAWALVCGVLVSACVDRALAPSAAASDTVRTSVVWTDFETAEHRRASD